MARTHRELLPPRLAERLSAQDRAQLEALQAGLVAHLQAAEPPPAEPPDPWQATAELAQWYLVIASEPAAAGVSVDADRCAFMLGEAAERGCLPSAEGVAELQRAWLTSARWPCFPGEDAPPLLRGR